MRRDWSGALVLLCSLPLLVSLVLSLLWLTVSWEALPWILCQWGCALLGAGLEGLLVFLTRRDYQPLRLLPLAGLLVPEFFALRAAVRQSGFLWELEVMMILILALHYFLGWLWIWLLFRKKEEP